MYLALGYLPCTPSWLINIYIPEAASCGSGEIHLVPTINGRRRHNLQRNSATELHGCSFLCRTVFQLTKFYLILIYLPLSSPSPLLTITSALSLVLLHPQNRRTWRSHCLSEYFQNGESKNLFSI